MPFWGFVKKRAVLSVALIVCMATALLVGNIFIVDLLVDTLLPLLGVAGVLCMALLRNRQRAATASAAVLCMALVLVKNSGLFFAAAVTFMLWACALHGKGCGKALGALVSVALSILCVILLWRLHVARAFGSADVGSHAVSLVGYGEGLSQKLEQGLLGQIGLNFFQKATDPAGLPNRILILPLPLMAGLWLCLLKQPVGKKLLGLLLFTLACCFLWQVALLWAYLFTSFSAVDALNIPSYERYSMSGTLFAAGMGLWAVLLALSALPERGEARGLAVALCVLICTTPLLRLRDRLSLLYRDDGAPPLREKLETLYSQEDVGYGKKYWLLLSEADLAYQLSRYLLGSPHVRGIYPWTDPGDPALWDNPCDVLIFTDENIEMMDAWVPLAEEAEITVVMPEFS